MKKSNQILRWETLVATSRPHFFFLLLLVSFQLVVGMFWRNNFSMRVESPSHILNFPGR
jgi:hypothetical protein